VFALVFLIGVNLVFTLLLDRAEGEDKLRPSRE
jgi:hypothetical protein